MHAEQISKNCHQYIMIFKLQNDQMNVDISNQSNLI